MLLPGMKIGINHKTNSISSLKSWRYDGSPDIGEYTLAMDPNNTNQFLMSYQSSVLWSSRNWKNGWFELLKNLCTDRSSFEGEGDIFHLLSIPKIKELRDSTSTSLQIRYVSWFFKLGQL
uniref:Uncharacterized protein n=1 Tax=Cucumis sativus TaxID=3659 RepID=A0A0A0K6K0_CUCSA